jgi:hypothetical protein
MQCDGFYLHHLLLTASAFIFNCVERFGRQFEIDALPQLIDVPATKALN